jgi:hypothetical protein
VEPGDDENVINGSFLKGRDHGGPDETAVTEQHGAQNCAALRAACKQRVHSCEQVPTRPRDALRYGRPRAVNELQQFSAAQRSREIDSLAREIPVQIERAGIEEISRRPRAQHRLDAVAGTKPFGRACRSRPAVKARAQSAAADCHAPASSTASRSIS